MQIDDPVIVRVSILVFLELALGHMDYLLRLADVLHSFNPCFLGTCPRIDQSLHRTADELWFQSLFSWNLPSDCIVGYDLIGSTVSVSILVFLELALGSWSHAFMPSCVSVFQSLFSWNLPSDLA